jgi:uncharacterized protein (DUF433 family)
MSKGNFRHYVLHFRNIAPQLNLFLVTSKPTSGRMEFPGRFEHCLRAEGSSSIVASKEGLELTDDLLIGVGKTGGDKSFLVATTLKPTKGPFVSMLRSLDHEFQKETKNAKRLLELFPKCGKVPNMTRFALLNRITVEPGVMSGHPCIRGMRVTVSNVLRLLAAHHDKQRILEAYPYLEEEDIDACLEYAAMLANESEIEAVA